MNKNANILITWNTYILKEIVKTLSCFVCGLYLFYVLFDIMAHLKQITQAHSSIKTWLLYYMCGFSKRFDILLAFSMLLTTIRILLKHQSHNEFVAMLAGGVSFRKLMRPFLLICAVSVGLVLANYEWFLPYALQKVEYIEMANFKKISQVQDVPYTKEILLNDGTKIFYHSYDPITKSFQDVYWICSADEIYHMKSLSSIEQNPVGKMSDKIIRQSDGKMTITESLDERICSDMHFDDQSLKNSITPPEQQSLSQLFRQLPLGSFSSSLKVLDIKSYFYYKALFPLLCVLAFIAPCPKCLGFRRHIPAFMIYLLGIAFLFCFLLLLQATLTISKSHMVNPMLLIFTPWTIALYYFAKKYARL